MAKSLWNTAKVGPYKVSKSPSGYGFSISEHTAYPENELLVAISSGQNGKTAFGIILAEVDFGMRVHRGEVASYEATVIAKAIDQAVSDICVDLHWHEKGETSRFSEAIYEAVQSLISWQ